MSARSREWVFTLNNYDNDDRGHLGLHWATYCVYLCYQPEVAPTTNTKHLQGYLCLLTPRTLRGVKQSVFGTERMRGVHLEIARGTKDECRTYCSKDESRDLEAGFGHLEFGAFAEVPDRRGQGARNDIAAAVAVITAGGDLRTVASDHAEVFVRYHRGLTALQSTIHAKPRVREEGGLFRTPRVLWYHGSTGSGKTHAVFVEIGEAECYMKPPANSWWDGYRGESIVILDDYRGNWFSFGYLLRLLDKYPMQVEVKGGYVHFAATTIYITCPRNPTELYASLEDRSEGSVAQLLRRITEVRSFGEPDPPPQAMIFDPI